MRAGPLIHPVPCASVVMALVTTCILNPPHSITLHVLNRCLLRELWEEEKSITIYVYVFVDHFQILPSYCPPGIVSSHLVPCLLATFLRSICKHLYLP